MSTLFISKTIPPETLDTLDRPALWFIFYQNQLLMYKNNTVKSIPEIQETSAANLFHTDKIKILTQHYLGLFHHQHCYCVEVDLNSPENLPGEFILQPLRQAGMETLNPEFFHLAGRALQILNWDKNHRFCGCCGNVLNTSQTERVKICPACDLFFYPRISPCIIVLIKRGKEILLARSAHFTQNVYSALAGFIEPGETAEHAVEREVMEEVGLKVKNIHYHFSQPWPFPDSLMLGFTAEHAAGEITIDGMEIEDAGWFTTENLPALPASMSIAKKLIDLFIDKKF